MEEFVHDIGGVSLYSEDAGKPPEHLLSEIMQSHACLGKNPFGSCVVGRLEGTLDWSNKECFAVL